MFVRLRYEVEGDVQVSRAFDVAAAYAEDLSEPLGEIGEAIRQHVGRQFGSEGAASGEPWPRLSRAYAVWKELNWPGRSILVREGDMRREMLSRAAVTVTPRTMIYEPASDIAAYHQGGKGHLPARKMVNLTAADRRDWDRAIASWINGMRHRFFS